MKQIRKNVFETNSSSVHSLSISGKDNYDYTQLDDYIEEDYGHNGYGKYLKLNFETFGWYWDSELEENSAIAKLEYILTAIACFQGYNINWSSREDKEEAIKEVMKSDDFQKFEDDVKYALSKHDIHITGIEINPDEDGYVDHQSLDYYVSPDGMYYIFARDGITLEDYIFNKCYSLNIDNDNH
jgi:hypothetical protein